jgi:hypothetical protein
MNHRPQDIQRCTIDAIKLEVSYAIFRANHGLYEIAQDIANTAIKGLQSLKSLDEEDYDLLNDSLSVDAYLRIGFLDGSALCYYKRRNQETLEADPDGRYGVEIVLFDKQGQATERYWIEDSPGNSRVHRVNLDEDNEDNPI